MSLVSKILLFGLVVAIIIAVIIPIMHEIRSTGEDAMDTVKRIHDGIR